MNEPLTVAQAATALGITPGRVIQHIAEGRLPGRKFGERVWMLDPSDVAAFQARPTGYPKGRKRK